MVDAMCRSPWRFGIGKDSPLTLGQFSPVGRRKLRQTSAQAKEPQEQVAPALTEHPEAAVAE
jgi:hypothetical protein